MQSQGFQPHLHAGPGQVSNPTPSPPLPTTAHPKSLSGYAPGPSPMLSSSGDPGPAPQSPGRLALHRQGMLIFADGIRLWAGWEWLLGMEWAEPGLGSWDSDSARSDTGQSCDLLLTCFYLQNLCSSQGHTGSRSWLYHEHSLVLSLSQDPGPGCIHPTPRSHSSSAHGPIPSIWSNAPV